MNDGINTKEPVITQGRRPVVTATPRPKFEPKLLVASSLGTQAVMQSSSAVPRSMMMRAPGGGLEKHEAAGGTGAWIQVDCDGAEVGRITWKNGKILTEGEQTVEAGCDGGSSSS